MAEETDDTTDDGPDDGPDGDIGPRREGRVARLERMLAPKPAAPKGGKGGAPTKWSVDRLDGRERLYCYVASVAAVIFSLLIYVGETSEKHFHPAKNQFSPVTALLVGLGCAVLLAVTTWIGRRALVGFVALFAFLGFENSALIIGVPFLVLAIWLLYRSYKVQKEATARLRADREAGGGTTAARTPRSAATSGRSAAEARAARKKGPTGPEPNKRFTPKKPAPKPIPPPKQSRRERKAAQASE
jgi:membrane protein implicated in regulation of membrane protease activity